MGKDFTITINASSPRSLDFIEVFGRREVHIKSFLPQLMKLPDFDEPQLCYLLDLELLSEEELTRLAIYISEKFNAKLDAVVAALRVTEMPILAADCIVSVENPQRWIDLDDAPFPGIDDLPDYWDDDEYDEDYWGDD
jgi:hypothetical protein